MSEAKSNSKPGLVLRPLLWGSAAALLLLASGGSYWVIGRKAVPVEASAAPMTAPIVRERRLPSGTLCRMDLRATDPTNGCADKLEGLEVSISGTAVHVPTESYSDLRDVNVRVGLEFAEFANDTYLLLCGGPDALAWCAKFTIRSNQVVARDLTRGTGPAVNSAYGPPFEIRYGVIPSDELERIRKETR